MIRGFQWDLARQVERLDWLLAQLPRYADWGYNRLYLHLEDAVEYPSLPGVARRDAYTYQQLEKLVKTAGRAGLQVVPIVNLLGHTQYLIKVPQLRDLNELRAPDGSPLERGQICPLHPRTLEIAEKLMRDTAPFCTAGQIHVGLDESFHLGKHPLSRREIARAGRAAHFGRYVGRLHALAAAKGLQMGMWADMLYFLPEAVPFLPPDAAVYEWYYYKFSRRPRVELFNFAESKVGERLRQRGLEYWGCPMNGAFRYEPVPHFRDRLENITGWWRHCHRSKAAGFLVTSWESNRLAAELPMVVDAAAASLWLEPGLPEPEEMLARGFARVFGGNGRTAARRALDCDQFPFAGYPRWQINSRWDAVSPRDPMPAFRQEERHFRRLAAPRGRGVPIPLQASIEFRHYLAARDVFVREVARGDSDPKNTRAFAQAARKGLRAAKKMWARTRSQQTRVPNEEMVRADLQRLNKLAAPHPSRWQLCYRVINFAPAAQRVTVEQQTPDGRWVEREGCHTIEFLAAAARPRGGFTREHAAPVTWDGDPNHWPRLRLTISGMGQAKIANVVLLQGQVSWPAQAKTILLGRPAPQRGWPKFQEGGATGSVPVKFTKGKRCHAASS